MATKQPEGRIVKKIMDYLKQVPGCCAEKRHGTAYGKAGQPDISGCILLDIGPAIMGQRFEIEVKVPGGRPTDLQAVRLEEWDKAGAVTMVAYSVEDVQEKIAAMQETAKNIRERAERQMGQKRA